MRNKLKNRRALSTVVTTLIILVISVLLASVVTYFAINVTSTRGQEESLALTKLHVWCPQDSSARPEAAFLIINTGGRDVVINKIAIRGQVASWSTVFTGTTDKSVTDDFYYTDLTGTPSINLGGSYSITLTAATGNVALNSGKSMVVFIDRPDSIAVNDIGLTVAIAVFTSQAMYYQESNVQSVATSGYIGVGASSDGLTITNAHAWYSSSSSVSQVAFVIKNTGSSQTDIDSLFINLAGYTTMYGYEGTTAVSSSLAYIPNISSSSTIESHTLTSIGQLSIQPGQTAIVYLTQLTGITGSDVGHSAEIDVSPLGYGNLVTVYVNVEPAT